MGCEQPTLGSATECVSVAVTWMGTATHGTEDIFATGSLPIPNVSGAFPEGKLLVLEHDEFVVGFVRPQTFKRCWNMLKQLNSSGVHAMKLSCSRNTTRRYSSRRTALWAHETWNDEWSSSCSRSIFHCGLPQQNYDWTTDEMRCSMLCM